MRMAYRNMQPCYYALYQGTVEDYEGGYQVGTHAEYEKPVKIMANISPARGDVVTRQFGDDDQYDRVIAIEDRDTPIDEYAVLWIETMPVLDAEGNTTTPWDYIVRRVARGLPKFGCTLCALSKVSVS